jgi:hypothetical protein
MIGPVTMRVAFAVVLALHALIHLLGFLKAFELVRMTQLTMPISRSIGLVWLAGATLFLASTVALVAAPRWFWLLGAVGLIAPQVAIVASWSDPRFGTLANALTLRFSPSSMEPSPGGRSDSAPSTRRARLGASPSSPRRHPSLFVRQLRGLVQHVAVYGGLLGRQLRAHLPVDRHLHVRLLERSLLDVLRRRDVQGLLLFGQVQYVMPQRSHV